MIAYRSISLRLTAWFSSVFFAGLALFGAVMWFDLKTTLTSGRSHTLERRADRLEDLLRGMAADSPAVRARKFQAFADATGGGLVEVFRSDGVRALPSPSAAAQTFTWPHVQPLKSGRFTEVEVAGQPYRVLEHPFALGSQALVLCLAAPLEANRVVLNSFSAGLLWAIPALLAIAALGGYLLSRRALKPVDEITAATQSISVSNLSERLPVPETRDELQRLSETCNAMLSRLESAVTEIKRFTGDASHELRTPVSFVRTTAELALRNRQIDPASKKAFEEIVAECGKANRLLKDMLTLARADSGNAQLAFEQVDLVEVLKAMAPKARLMAEERRHTLSVHANAGSHATIWGDYAVLQRLLLILVDNAAKYTASGGAIRIALSVNDLQAALTVEDNGMGIPPEDLPYIFERFYRADPSRSRVEGSGLGLSIAMWIATIHGAALSAASQPSAGSIFTVIFPLLPEKAVTSRETNFAEPVAARLA